MSFLAAMLLLNMDLSDAFIAFANLINRACQMAFFMVDQNMVGVFQLLVGYMRCFARSGTICTILKNVKNSHRGVLVFGLQLTKSIIPP